MRHRCDAGGFTMIEVLAVVAIIILVVAMALPSFSAMMRSQRWTAAISALQNAVFRTRTLALNERYDHSIEFCEGSGSLGRQYFRIECESALLESIPELNNYLHNVVQSYIHRLPTDWFATYKNASGRVIGGEDHPWTPAPNVRFEYDGPIQDVDRYNVKDNLRVDDDIQLPYGIKVDFEKSQNLYNYDRKPQTDQDMPQYGWDETDDLRFDVGGVLRQPNNPEIALRREIRPVEYRRVQVLRSTGRVRER